MYCSLGSLAIPGSSELWVGQLAERQAVSVRVS